MIWTIGIPKKSGLYICQVIYADNCGAAEYNYQVLNYDASNDGWGYLDGIITKWTPFEKPEEEFNFARRNEDEVEKD